jgi:hypothetical protein
VDLLEKARRQGHHFDILAKPVKPEQSLRDEKRYFPLLVVRNLYLEF